MFTEEESHGHVRFNVLGKLPENIHVPGGTSAIETRKSSQGNVRAYGAVNWFGEATAKAQKRSLIYVM